jgi:hypothetical protein
MAGSPVGAVSPSVPGPHQETESEQGITESDEETGSEPGSEAAPGADATKTGSDREDGSNQDAASVKTTTTGLFYEVKSDGPGPEPIREQHKLGLDINEIWYASKPVLLFIPFSDYLGSHHDGVTEPWTLLLRWLLIRTDWEMND